MGHRRAPAVTGHADAGRRGGVHGQRLRADAPPGLRRARHRRAHAARLRVMRAILLGPQRRPTLDAVVRSLDLAGPFATVTAGWQEREPDDGELSTILGGRVVKLELYRRWLDVQERDPEYAAAERALQAMAAELQELYLLRLDYALQAAYALQRRAQADQLGGTLTERIAEPVAEAVTAVRELDAAHLAHLNEVRREFFARLRPHDRPVIAEHRAAVAGLL